MRSLIIGSGAREHIIAEKLADGSQLFAYMNRKNTGIARLCREFKLGSHVDFERIRDFANKISPDLIFVGPEDPLVAGIADTLENVIGPGKASAKLEGDKGFCRKLIRENVGYGYPDFEISESCEEAKEAIDRIGDVVVKPVGLTGGKGVRVMGSQLKDSEEAVRYAAEIIKTDGRAVIEEKLEGEEFSFQVFCDGKHLSPMPPVQDHKYAYEGDKGPMTGGMGSYSDADHFLPFLSENDVKEARKIMEKTVRGLERETGERYKGVLYGGFMATEDGVKVLEYNVRFGDPEAMNVLPLLKNDLSDICASMLDGNLKRAEFDSKATVCKYLVPDGYPKNPEGGSEVNVDEEKIRKGGARLYYGSVEEKGGKFYTSTSRSFGVLGIADSIEEAERVAEKGISTIENDRIFHRKDIGKRELIKRKIEHMRRLRRL